MNRPILPQKSSRLSLLQVARKGSSYQMHGYLAAYLPAAHFLLAMTVGMSTSLRYPKIKQLILR